jgi:hypothetical protein
MTPGRRTGQRGEVSGWPTTNFPEGFELPQVDGVGGLHLSPHQGTDGSGGANEAVFPPTHQDSDR